MLWVVGVSSTSIKVAVGVVFAVLLLKLLVLSEVGVEMMSLLSPPELARAPDGDVSSGREMVTDLGFVPWAAGKFMDEVVGGLGDSLRGEEEVSSMLGQALLFSPPCCWLSLSFNNLIAFCLKQKKKTFYSQENQEFTS